MIKGLVLLAIGLVITQIVILTLKLFVNLIISWGWVFLPLYILVLIGLGFYFISTLTPS